MIGLLCCTNRQRELYKVPSPRWWRFLALCAEPPAPIVFSGIGRQFTRWKELSVPSRVRSPNCAGDFKKWVNGRVIFLPITFYNTDNAAKAGYQIRRPANCGKMVLQYNKSATHSWNVPLHFTQIRYTLCYCVTVPQCFCFAAAAWLFILFVGIWWLFLKRG